MENASSWAEFENQFSERLVAQAIDAQFPGLKKTLLDLRQDIDDLNSSLRNPFSVPDQQRPTAPSNARIRRSSTLPNGISSARSNPESSDLAHIGKINS